MIKVTKSESKMTPAKKNIQLKNVSVQHMRLVDATTGEDFTADFIKEMPAGINTVDFKITIELDEPDDLEADED